MPRFRQYAVHPYEKDFGFSPGFYGQGAKSMEISMAGRRKRRSEKLSRGDSALKREIEGKYAERDMIRVVLMAGIPVAALSIWGVVRAVRGEPKVEGLGQIKLPTIEVPGLGPVGAALPYLGASGVLLIGQKLVPAEMKAARFLMLGGAVVSSVLGVVAGVQSGKKPETIPQQAVAAISVSGASARRFFGEGRFDLTVKNLRSVPVSITVSGELSLEETGAMEKRWEPVEMILPPGGSATHEFYLGTGVLSYARRRVVFALTETSTGRLIQRFEAAFASP